ncbi:MAG: response regulator [Magnetococcales bacterium]|nr:response regulator [Magnetococcales bacterium]
MTISTPTFRVLIVDDVPGNIKSLAEILKGKFQIFMATSGEKALEIVANQKIDLILLDIIMPEMDGYQVCSLLKSNPQTAPIPVIFVTAHTDSNDRAIGLAAGGAAFVSKPTSPPLLIETINHHLSKQSH